jgi:hypothetical protein
VRNSVNEPTARFLGTAMMALKSKCLELTKKKNIEFFNNIDGNVNEGRNSRE